MGLRRLILIKPLKDPRDVQKFKFLFKYYLFIIFFKLCVIYLKFLMQNAILTVTNISFGAPSDSNTRGIRPLRREMFLNIST